MDQNRALEAAIKFNSDDLAETQARVNKMLDDFESAKFDDQLSQKTKQILQVSAEKDELLTEFSKASLQASERAKLDLKRNDLKKKQAFVERTYVLQSTLLTHASKSD